MKFIYLLLLFLVISCSEHVDNEKSISTAEKYKCLCECLNEAYIIEDFDSFLTKQKACYKENKWESNEEADGALKHMLENCPKATMRYEDRNYLELISLKEDSFTNVSNDSIAKLLKGKWNHIGQDPVEYWFQENDSLINFKNDSIQYVFVKIKTDKNFDTYKVLFNLDDNDFSLYKLDSEFTIENIGVYDSLVMRRFHFGKYSMMNIGYSIKNN